MIFSRLRCTIWGAFLLIVLYMLHVVLSLLYIRNDIIPPYRVKDTSGLFQGFLDEKPVTNSDPGPDRRSEEQYNHTLFFSRDTSHYINPLDTKPPQYFANFKNPCWEEEMPTSSPYKQNPLYHDQKYGGTLKRIEKVWIETDINKQMRCLPYYYVAGFEKCGTTDLFNKLIFHPEVAHPPRNEIHWWSRLRVLQKKIYNDAWLPISLYADFFDEAAREISEKTSTQDLKSPDNKEPYHPVIVGDGSPTTVWDFKGAFSLPGNDGFTKPYFITPHYIHHVTPEARILISVRNPTSRLYSSYLYFGDIETKSPALFHERIVKSIAAWDSCMAVAASHWDCLFNRTLIHLYPINGLGVGMYHYYIKEWLEIFPRDQIMITRLEDYAANRTIVLRNVFQFLGLRLLTDKEMSLIEDDRIKNQNEEKNSSGPMLDKTKELLDKFYAQHNKALAELLGDDRFAYT